MQYIHRKINRCKKIGAKKLQNQEQKWNKVTKKMLVLFLIPEQVLFLKKTDPLLWLNPVAAPDCNSTLVDAGNKDKNII